MNECFKLYKAAHACAKGPRLVRPLAGVFRHLSQLLFACHIGGHAEIGEGCLFQHNGLGCVISEKAVIGKNVEFYQHVTVGALRGGYLPLKTVSRLVLTLCCSATSSSTKEQKSAQVPLSCATFPRVPRLSGCLRRYSRPKVPRDFYSLGFVK